MLKLLFFVAVAANVVLVVSADKCGANEEYSKCPDAVCEPKTCDQLGFPISCPAQATDGSCPGKPGCICKSGYVRNSNGNCIPTSHCPSCGGDKNAEAGCGVNCNRHCSDIGKEPGACIAVCYFNACDCRDGYYLDDNTGKCVLPNQCTEECPKNEIFSNCTNSGCNEPRKCSELGIPQPCPDISITACKKGCLCIDGYLRADNGTCIPKSECPTCNGDPNAKAGCGINCGRHCSNYDSKEKISCIAICKVNSCDCRDDYVYDDNTDKCVFPEDCTPVCKNHEVYSECVNGGCDARNCSQLGKPVPCVKLDPSACIKGCICEDGYLRASNGTCVPKNQCHVCPTNEIFDECSYEGQCSPGTCDSIGKGYNCPAQIHCKAQCRCKDDYYRNKLGQCISEDECLRCPGPHEYFSCGGACVNECATIKEQNQTHCPIINIKCNELCYCEEGYAKDSNNICIPIEDCPDTDSCGCGGDPNAEPGCGTNCGKHCSDYNEKPAACPQSCILNGCDCKDGYAFDDNIGKCVRPCDCSPITTTTTTTTATTCGNGDQQTALDRFQDGNTDFTLNFLYQMIKKNPLVSVVMSPFICLVPLAELALYTEPGESYDQLMNAFNLNNKDEIRSVFFVVLNSLKTQQNVTLDLGAKIYVNENYQLTDNFQTDTKNIFDAEAENINFGDPDNAADIINAWVKAITRGLIPSIVSPDMFSVDTRMVLTNAIYFLGNWVDQFNPNSTRNEDFHISDDKTVQVPMMYRKGSYKYTESEDLDCKIVEIPYKGGNFSYVILVPNQIDGYSTVAEKIRDPQVLNNALDALQSETCYLYIPRHEITTSIDLTEILNLLNITDLFDVNKSNLSGIFTNSEQLGVSDAIQKANIKVDETGTEAAAVTAIVVGTTSVSQPETIYEIKADRPFLYILYQDRQPLFCGAFAANES